MIKHPLELVNRMRAIIFQFNTPEMNALSTITDELLIALSNKEHNKYYLESLIHGHIEAMRPLLDEWAKSE